MTHKAREVLGDCRLALSLLEEEVDAHRWRIHWAAAVALIRAVGHVLDKIDGEDPLIKQVAGNAFRRWSGTALDHEIFREFIERERNNLLKEYHSDVYPLARIAIALEFTVPETPGCDPVKSEQVAEVEENLYRPLLDGPWEGDDARDVLMNAIEWWQRQLDGIDREVLALRKPG